MSDGINVPGERASYALDIEHDRKRNAFTRHYDVNDGINVRTGLRIKSYWPAVALTFAGVAVLFALICAFRRGGVADEYSTIYFAQPTVSLGTFWNHIWPTETNPPFFYALARYWAMITGPSLFAQRLINIIPLLFFVSWFLYSLKKYPQHRSFLICIILFAFSSHYFMWSFPVYRSYFSQYAAGLVFLGSFSISYLNRDRHINVFQLAALPILVTFHQVTALYTGVLLLVMFAVEIYRGNYLRAGSLAAVSVISVIPVLAFVHLQMDQTSAVLTKVSWIAKHGPLESFIMILKFIPSDLGKNFVAIILALTVLAIPKLRGQVASIALILIILTAALGGTFVILVINHFSPIIVERYLSLFAAEMIVATALTVAALFQEKQVLAALVTINAALYLVYNFHTISNGLGWSQDGATLANFVSECPGTRIHAGSMPPKTGPDPAEMIGPPQSEIIGLRYTAALYHLKLLPISPDVPQTCPVIYWTEYRGPTVQDIKQNQNDLVTAANASAGFGLSAQSLLHTRAIKTLGSGNGIILVVDPD